MYITTPIGPKSVSSLSYQILFTKSSLDVVRSIIEPSIYCAVIDANYSLSPGFIHSQLAVFANRLLWTNLTISRNINNVGLSHCGWVFIVQRTYVVWGGRCIVAFYIITVTFVVGNQEIRSEPRERKILHIMGSDGSTGAPDAGLWWFQPPFRSMPSPPPSPWLLCSSERSCESANKTGG